MVVEINLERRLDSAVDDSEQVFLPRCQSLGSDESGAANITCLVVAVPDVLPVNETCIEQDRTAIGSRGAIRCRCRAWNWRSILGKVVAGVYSEM